MKTTILVFFALAFSFQAQASWKLRSVYKPVPLTEVQRSTLFFSSGDVTKAYFPVNPPFGMVSRKKYKTAYGEVFLTGWSQSARSTLFRVFDMSQAEELLVCSITSYSDSSSLKVDEGVFYIKALDDVAGAKMQWTPCAKVNSDTKTEPSKPLAQ